MKPKSDKIEVVFNHELISKEPLLAVKILTYNHEKYIRDCLEGIVMQQTNFEFVVYVREDFSTDKTRKVLLEYQKNYPHLFKLYLCNENLYSLRKSSGMSKDINSKYIALCEGDDYWTDPLKLQKQVDFLEANPSIKLCGHSTSILGDNKILEKKLSFKESHFLTHKKVILQNPIHTSSFVYNKEHVTNLRRDLKNPGGVGDYVVLVCGSQPNGIYIFKDVMSMYRVNNANSVWMGAQDNSKRLNQMEVTINNMLSHDKFNNKTKKYLELRGGLRNESFVNRILHKFKKKISK
ncbi:MAG: glycosyltransferase [Flavobacteriaceae bacterium]|nr:glycosyltransferase [Flavobacteriaceae bacterium]